MNNIKSLEESEKIKARIQASIECLPKEKAEGINKQTQELLRQWESK